LNWEEDRANPCRFVHILLVQAERAWAQAMHMKSSHAEDNADLRITGVTRQHIISRLHKAATHANTLVEILQDRATIKATDGDYLEARAYAQCLAGAEEFERQSSQRKEDPASAWRQCIVHFSQAHVIYSALSYRSQKDLFKEVIGGTVDPSIRYAAYQSRLPRTVAISTVAKKHFPQERADVVDMIKQLYPAAFDDVQTKDNTEKDGTVSATAAPTVISWRGRSAPIADAAIGQAMASTEIATAQLSAVFHGESVNGDTNGVSSTVSTDSKVFAAAYDPVLTAAQDTVDAVRRSISDLTKEGVSESDSRMQDLRVSDLAANYTLVSWRIGRNRVLISSSGSHDDGLEFVSKPRPFKKSRKSKSTNPNQPEGNGRRITRLKERVVLYDATLQSIDSVKDLRGAARDSHFMAELDAKRAYFQALKCVNIGYSHAVVAGHKEALALFARAQTLAQTASAGLQATAKQGDSPPSLDVQADQLHQLTTHLELLLLRQRGLVALEQHKGDGTSKDLSSAKVTPVSRRLNEYPASGKVDLDNIVSWPPKVEPIPVKPIFLDLAWNYIQYPGTNNGDRVDEGEADERMEGIVNGVVDTAKQATNIVKEAVGVESTEEPNETPKKRGWFSFGRS